MWKSWSKYIVLFKSYEIFQKIILTSQNDARQSLLTILHTPSAPGVWSKGQNIFPESSHGAYQRKGNWA